MWTMYLWLIGWLSGNVKLGLIWGSPMHYSVFVLVCCAFCILGNVLLTFLEELHPHLVNVEGGGVSTAQLTERPTEPSISRKCASPPASHLALTCSH